jgi:hypothetical protein
MSAALALPEIHLAIDAALPPLALVESACRFCDPGEPCRWHRDGTASQRQFDKGRQRVPFDDLRRARLPTEGFQMKKLRRPYRQCPDWAASDRQLRFVLRSHPQAKAFFARWLAISYLYFRLNFSASEVAAELNMTGKAVERVVSQLRKRAGRLVENP